MLTTRTHADIVVDYADTTRTNFEWVFLTLKEQSAEIKYLRFVYILKNNILNNIIGGYLRLKMHELRGHANFQLSN